MNLEAAREQHGQLSTRQGVQYVEDSLSSRVTEDFSLRAVPMRAQILSSRERGGAKAEEALFLECFTPPSREQHVLSSRIGLDAEEVMASEANNIQFKEEARTISSRNASGTSRTRVSGEVNTQSTRVDQRTLTTLKTEGFIPTLEGGAGHTSIQCRGCSYNSHNCGPGCSGVGGSIRASARAALDATSTAAAATTLDAASAPTGEDAASNAGTLCRCSDCTISNTGGGWRCSSLVEGGLCNRYKGGCRKGDDSCATPPAEALAASATIMFEGDPSARWPRGPIPEATSPAPMVAAVITAATAAVPAASAVSEAAVTSGAAAVASRADIVDAGYHGGGSRGSGGWDSSFSTGDGICPAVQSLGAQEAGTATLT